MPDTTFVRDWFVEGQLIFDGEGKRVENLWHPLYGPLPQHEAERLRNWMLDADDERLVRMDPAMDEYDDFRARHHPDPIPAHQLTKRRALVRAAKELDPTIGTSPMPTGSASDELSKSIPNRKTSRKNLGGDTKSKHKSGKTKIRIIRD